VGQNEIKVFMGSLWLCKQMIVKVTRYLICFSDNLLVFYFLEVCQIMQSVHFLYVAMKRAVCGDGWSGRESTTMHSDN